MSSSPRSALALLPIRPISSRERQLVADHLLCLSPHDRYLRFGYPATDDHIGAYVVTIDFDRDDVFGIFNRKLELVAMAHLALPAEISAHKAAEFGVSVSTQSRGRGYGAALFERAVVAARSRGIKTLVIHALSENTAMLKIARNAGASVVRDGSDSEAKLSLPAGTVDTLMSDLVLRTFAWIDFGMKSQAKRLWSGIRPSGHISS